MVSPLLSLLEIKDLTPSFTHTGFDMSAFFNRRDWLKVMGIAGAGSLLPRDVFAGPNGKPLIATPGLSRPEARLRSSR